MKANEVLSTGGGMYGAKFTSVWGTNVTTTFTTSYNNKGGNQPDSYEGQADPRPDLQHAPECDRCSRGGSPAPVSLPRPGPTAPAAASRVSRPTARRY